MSATTHALSSLTADDVMTHGVLRLKAEMPIREAARLLLQSQVGGAPVVDARGRCIGVLTTVDFLRLAASRSRDPPASTDSLPVSCSFQRKYTRANGQEVVQCTLAPGVCPIQSLETEPDGGKLNICTEPHCVLTDWQMVDLEKLPDDDVRAFMTSNPVTVHAETSIRTLAQMMIDAHIHRLIVVDDDHKPVGIVSSTNLLAVLAQMDDES